MKEDFTANFACHSSFAKILGLKPNGFAQQGAQLRKHRVLLVSARLKLIAHPMFLQKPCLLQSIQFFVHRPGHRARQAGNVAAIKRNKPTQSSRRLQADCL